jgi:chorismate-pyruvate lyase
MTQGGHQFRAGGTGKFCAYGQIGPKLPQRRYMSSVGVKNLMRVAAEFHMECGAEV